MSERKVSPLAAVGALLALLLMVAWMAGFFDQRIEPGMTPLPGYSATDAYTVTVQQLPITESVPGSVEAKQATIISSRTLARITAIHVRSGDPVTEGQLLLELEKEDLQSRALQAREHIRAVTARVREAEQNLSRALELHQRGLIAVADRDAAQANRDALQAELVSAQRALEEAQTAEGFADIRSPINGRVVDRFAEPGDTASPGAKLLSLYNPLSLRVEAQVREALALALAVGREVAVELPALEQRAMGTIEEIVPAAEPGSRSFLVKVRLVYDRQLLPGMYARLLVPAGTAERILVPRDRVATVGQLNVAWVAAEGGPQRRFLRLGEGGEGPLVEVVAGLQPGDEVLPQDYSREPGW
jgi:RND family efflux transporter MFP subunit